MKKISQNQLKDMLAALKGTTAISMVVETQKRLPGIGDVIKAAKVNAMIGFNFQNSVNNSLERDGQDSDFKSQTRKWGQRIQGTPLVKHKGNYYLESKVERILGAAYRDLNGKILEGIKEEPSDQRVTLRDFKLDSIRILKFKGEEYEVKI